MIPPSTALLPLQVTIQDTIEETIAEVIAYLPTVVSALLILIVGYIIGRIVGAIVTRILTGLGIGKYTTGSAGDRHRRAEDGDQQSDDEDGIAKAVGKLVAFYIYFLTFVAAANVLDIAQLSEVLADISAYLPVVFGAIVVLIVGFVGGRIIGDIVADVVSGFDIGPHLRDTPLEQFGDREGEFGHYVGLLVTYYIYLLTLLTAADIINIEELSQLLDTFASYIPALIGGLVVLLVGIWVAERVGEMVTESGEGAATKYAGLGVKLLIYYITITIALGAIGFETFLLASLFTTFVVALFGAAALAIAIGAGVALGLGAQDYVRKNISDWMSSARGAARSDGGTSTGTDTGGHSGTGGGSDLDSTGSSDSSDSGPSGTDDSDIDHTEPGGSDPDSDNTGLDDSVTDTDLDDSDSDSDEDRLDD